MNSRINNQLLSNKMQNNTQNLNRNIVNNQMQNNNQNLNRNIVNNQMQNNNQNLNRNIVNNQMQNLNNNISNNNQQNLNNNISNNNQQPISNNNQQPISNNNQPLTTDSYNMKKLILLSNIDKKNSKGQTQLGIYSHKETTIEKDKLKNMFESRLNENNKFRKDIEESKIKRNNNPYKGIIKNYNYDREIKETDITIYKVSENLEEKNEVKFKEVHDKYKNTKKIEDEEIKDTYALDKQHTHKKKFEREHVYKFCANIDVGEDNLRVDRIEIYKKEQEKQEEKKVKIDNVLNDLINGGAISTNYDSIDYSKIDPDALAKQLKETFGEEEYNKMLNDAINGQSK